MQPRCPSWFTWWSLPASRRLASRAEARRGGGLDREPRTAPGGLSGCALRGGRARLARSQAVSGPSDCVRFYLLPHRHGLEFFPQRSSNLPGKKSKLRYKGSSPSPLFLQSTLQSQHVTSRGPPGGRLLCLTPGRGSCLPLVGCAPLRPQPYQACHPLCGPGASHAGWTWLDTETAPEQGTRHASRAPGSKHISSFAPQWRPQVAVILLPFR